MGSIGLVNLAYGYHRGAGMINAMQIMAPGVCGYQHLLLIICLYIVKQFGFIVFCIVHHTSVYLECVLCTYLASSR